MGAGSTTIYFERRVFTTPAGSTTSYSGSSGPVSGQQGSYAWTGERVRGNSSAGTNANAPNIRPTGYVQLTVPATNYKNLKLVVAFADPHCSTCTGNNVSPPDRIRLRYSFDGSPFVTAGLLVNSGGSASSGAWGIDTSAPLDSVSDSILGQAYRDVTAPISGTGTSLRVQVEVDANAPEITFDNIRVIGDVDAAAKPTLATLETSTLTYTEGQASPVQVTNTLTVGYSDNSATNITGGTVSVSSGFTSGDLLNYSTQGTISGTYSAGVLTLTGTASQAAYQAALRTVTYSNSNTSTLPNGTRQITFQLSNGSAQSNTPLRNLNVTAVLTPGTLPYTENFDSDGEGTRYFGNSYVRQSTTTGFFRSTTSPAYFGTDKIGNITFTGWSSGYWFGEGTKLINPTTGLAVQLAPVNAAGATGLKFVVAVGSSSTSGSAPAWDAADYFKLYYRTSNSGSWTEFGSFTTTADGVLHRGGNADSVAVGTALHYFTFPLPAAAAVSTLDFQLVQTSDGDEELAFDNIRISGQTTVNSIVRASANPTNATTVNYTVTFGTAVTGLTANNFSLTTSGLSGATVGTPVSTGTGSTWTVPVTTGTGSGTLTLNLANDTGLSYGISTTLPFVGETYTIDKTAPTVAITSGTASSGGSSNSNPFSYTITFSESTTSFAQTDVTVSGGTIASFSGSGTTYTLTVTPSAAGSTVNVSVAAGAATDAAGNGNVVSNTYSITYTVAPTVTTTSPATNITATTATVSGTLTASGGAALTSYGVVYVAGTGTPTLTNKTGQVVSGTTSPSSFPSAFSAGLTGLTGSTQYTAAAYATNSAGTSYGSNVTFTTTAATATVTGISKLAPTATQSAGGTATATVSFTVTFSASVSGVTTSNFSLTTTGISGASVTGVSPSTGPSATYTVTASTGSGSGTLQLNVANATGITPSVTNTPFNGTGAGYTITKSFAAAPQLLLQAGGSPSGKSDVTAFVDGVQVVQNGTSTAVANALQNGSFETNNLGTSYDFLYPSSSPAVVAAPWAFTSAAGVARIGTAGFGPAASGQGSFVGFLQSTSASGSITQNLAVPTGTYQVGFVAAQRTNQGTDDQVVNVYLGDGLGNVFIGTIQPTAGTYSAFTSAAFTVVAPPLTATVSTTSSSPTSTSPIPFSVSFSQSVGTTFTASDVTVTGGGTPANFSGSGSGPYTFTVTPSGAGTVTVSVAAGVANDANNTQNSASNALSVQYQLPVTAAPVVTAPTNGSLTNTATPTYSGTAPAGSTVTVFVDGASIGTTTATGGNFTLAQSTALGQGSHTVYATAQTSGSSVSANSTTNTFTVDTTPPTVTSVNRQTPAATTTNATTLVFRVTFSEAVNGVSLGAFSLATSGTSGTIASVSTVSTSVYDVTVSSASGNGTLGLNVKTSGTGITDVAGNALSGGATGQTYTLDQTAPTVTSLTSTAGSSGSSTSTSPFAFTVTFSEAVSGFSTSGITVSNGTVTTAPSGTSPGTTFTFTVTPTNANAATSVTIATGAAQDAAGNNSVASAAYTLTYVTGTTWTGTISPDWFTAANWSNNVLPTASISAIISSGTVFSPLITSGTATTLNLTVNSGATLNMSGGTLDVRGNLTVNGTFSPTDGTVIMGGGASNPSILGSARVRFWNLTVNSNNAQLSTSAGASVRRLLTLTGTFTTNGNTFTLESDATGTALVVNSGGVVTGNATVQRYIDASGNTGTTGYRHYSSPVQAATVGSLSTSAYGGSFTAQVNTAYNTADPNLLTLATYPNVFSYDESKIAGSPAVSFSDFDKGYQSPASTNTTLTPGRGYAVQIGNTEKVQFTGTLNNNAGTISNLTYAAANTAGAASAGWALIGNPYPAPLDWGTVGVSGTNSSLNGVDAAAYVFQSLSAYSGRYTSFTNGMGAGTGLIASGQGFFVHTSTPGTTGSVTLNNNNRVTTYANPAFQRTAETRPLVRLSLGLGSLPTTVAMAQDETFVYFEAGATSGFDGKYDAYKLNNPSGYYLGSVTPGASPVGLSIDARSPLAVATTTEIPLWVSLPAGSYTLTATELLNFATLAGGTQVQLRDALLGTLTDLATTPSYSFSVAANAAYAGRFALVFRTSQALAAASAQAGALVSLYPNPASHGRGAVTLAVTGLPVGVGQVEATVLNALGQVVRRTSLSAPANGAAKATLATQELATGVYLVRLTGAGLTGGLTCRLTVD
ncbi:MAG: Ig-like domain-containing protein [Janthinobacterium lividum]